MKVIIAGSRSLKDPLLVEQAIHASGFQISEIVSGACPEGVDALVEAYAKAHGIPLHRFAANWDSYGRQAGPVRNAAMARYADALIAIWDGASRGTASMLREAQRCRVPSFVFRILQPLRLEGDPS